MSLDNNTNFDITNKPFVVEIDINNSSMWIKLYYYLYTNKLLTEKQRRFILDECISVSHKSVLFFIVKDRIELKYEDESIFINYKKTRKSENSKNLEIRFDKIIISSYKSFEHLLSFLSIIEAIKIPDSPEEELSKYIWKEDRWRYSKIFKRRSLDTIYFHKKNEIYETIEKFLNDRDTYSMYKELDVPYKKIFLFYGIPGTGKTSLIRALASKFNYNISLVKNVMDMDDNSLEWMIGSLREKTFLVFEDIDCLFNKREMTDKTMISFSGILNLLDGVSSYDKLVIFITTNYIDKLDIAFRRRIDMFVEFNYANKNEISEMYNKFFKDNTQENFNEFYKKIKSKKLTINTLEKYFINCINKKFDPCESIDILDTYNSFVNDNIPSLYS